MAKTIFLLIISFLVINSQDSDNKDDTLVINYYYKDGRVYSIEEMKAILKFLQRKLYIV